MKNSKKTKMMIFLALMLTSSLAILIGSQEIAEIKPVNILKIFSSGMLFGALIFLVVNWLRDRKQAA